MTTQSKPCTRCLLKQAGEAELAAVIAERRAVIPAEKRADDGLYERRLAVCKDCVCLIGGTCAKCGCYVELRAAYADSGCPDVPPKW